MAGAVVAGGAVVVGGTVVDGSVVCAPAADALTRRTPVAARRLSAATPTRRLCGRVVCGRWVVTVLRTARGSRWFLGTGGHPTFGWPRFLY